MGDAEVGTSFVRVLADRRGEYVVDVARIAGRTVNVCRTHYAREFEHARHRERVDMETAIITARQMVSGNGVPIVCPPSNVVSLRRSA